MLIWDGECREPMVVYRCGGTDNWTIGTKDILQKLFYAADSAAVDDGEADIQEQPIVCKDMFSKPGLIIKFGEDGGSVGEAKKERAGNTLGWEEA